MNKYGRAAAKGAELVLMGFTILSPDGTRRDYYEPEAVFDAATLGAASFSVPKRLQSCCMRLSARQHASGFFS